MPAIPHVVRRGAMYYWRRRLPAALGESSVSAILTMRLGTCDPARARILAGQATALADIIFADALTMRLSPSQTKAIFVDSFSAHLSKLDAVAARERMDPRSDPQTERDCDATMGWVYRLLDTRGPDATVDPRARAQMQEARLSEAAIEEVAAMLALMQRQGVSREGEARLSALLSRHDAASSPINLALAESIVFNARSAACFEMARRRDGVKEETATWIAAAHCAAASPIESPAPSSRQTPKWGPATPTLFGSALPTAWNASISPAAVAFAGTMGVPHRDERLETSSPPRASSADPALVSSDPDERHFIVEMGEKLARHKVKNWDAKTRSQARQTFNLFAKFLNELGVQELRQLRQQHFVKFDELLDRLPTHYGKSPEDRTLSFDRLFEKAKKRNSPQGLNDQTINRHITFLQQLVDRANAEGHDLDNKICPSSLRRRIDDDPRQRRGFFSDDDFTAIFNLPLFHGCRAWIGDGLYEKGNVLHHCALYFVPILLYYTMARREEICGLMVDEVMSIDLDSGETIWYLKLDFNRQRRVKNRSSIRLVPLVPELIRLGFIDYTRLIKSLGHDHLFPDLYSPTTNSKMGDKFYKDFLPGLLKAVPGLRQRKLVIHSFRRSGGNILKKKKVVLEIRKDILGHKHQSTTERVYAEASELEILFDTLLKMPNVTKNLPERPINLLPWVAAKTPPPFSRARRAE